jgi:hypothetical protein
MMEKSFAVVGANFDSSGLNIGDGTRAAARFAIRGSKAQANWGVTGIQMALIAATYTDINTNGTVAHTAINAIAQPTIANVAASTHTNASTLYIANAPAAGTNATLTNPWAVYVAAGKSFLGDDLTITDAAAAQLNLVHTAGSVTGAIRVDGSGNWFFTGSNTSPLFGLGGTTSSFPALIRDGASIQVKLADNSANANLKVLNQAYSESTWDNNDEVPTKNAIRDETETNKHKPYSQTATMGANTSDATPTNLSVVYGLTTLPNNSTGWIKVTLTGNGSSGASTHNIKGIKYYSFNKSGGTLTLDAADVIIADKLGASVSTASWQVIVSSNQPVIEVTGVAAITIVWGAAVEILYAVEN